MIWFFFYYFQKIDSLLESKTRYIDELDKQNIIKNKKIAGLTYATPKPIIDSNLVGNIVSIKKNLLGSAFSTLVQAKLGKKSGSFGFGGSAHGSAHGSGGSGLFGAGASLPGLGSASFGAEASLPGVGGASFGAGAHSGSASTSFSASAGTY